MLHFPHFEDPSCISSFDAQSQNLSASASGSSSSSSSSNSSSASNSSPITSKASPTDADQNQSSNPQPDPIEGPTLFSYDQLHQSPVNPEDVSPVVYSYSPHRENFHIRFKSPEPTMEDLEIDNTYILFSSSRSPQADNIQDKGLNSGHRTPPTTIAAATHTGGPSASITHGYAIATLLDQINQTLLSLVELTHTFSTRMAQVEADVAEIKGILRGSSLQ
ncbi:hypothetical protein L2E82_35403 [Cichorium intybus]|uniref:Uncharacterized protein n=1 Tax=Cichorium intybus TaxID=13427 RepID=A0ACB9BNP7_CICIN|nr:hypothetical protein L2E82_35403 [Cichorium intybus]